jgi:hypothetical protein
VVGLLWQNSKLNEESYGVLLQRDGSLLERSTMLIMLDSDSEGDFWLKISMGLRLIDFHQVVAHSESVIRIPDPTPLVIFREKNCVLFVQ